MKALSKEKKYLSLIFLIFIVACIETDMYLPAFPDMMVYFHTTESMIQGLLTWNFIGICVSGPFYGPLSDSLGRKRVLMVALTLFLLGSIGTLFTVDINQMLFFRVLQGLGSGGCFTLGTAIIFDTFKAEKATKAINDLNCVIPVVMALAPLIGAYLNIHYGFRANFLAIAIFVVISFIVCAFVLEETLPKEKRAPLELKRILGDFGTAMRSFRFWAPTIIVSMIFAGYLVYISYSAILFVDHMGVTREWYPAYQGSVLIAFVIASLSANKLIGLWGVKKLRIRGLILLLLGGIGFMLAGFFEPKQLLLFHSMMLLYSFAAGWLIGPYFTAGMEALPDIRGVTASLITSFRLLFTAGVIGLAGKLFNGTVGPLVWVFIGLFIIGGLLAVIYECYSID